MGDMLYCKCSEGKKPPSSASTGVVKMEKFVAVVVNKGRKFRGEAYDIGAAEHTNSYQLPGWSGRGGWVTSVSVKLWSPTAGFVYANPNYIEAVTDKPEAEVQADYAKYVDYTINSTIAWCHSRKLNPTEKEVLDFARNVIRKHHPEMLALFDEKNAYHEDVATVVQSTLDWAFRLGYSNAKCVRIALKALRKKGVLDNPAFVPAWTIYLDLRGLGHLVTKYFADYGIVDCVA